MTMPESTAEKSQKFEAGLEAWLQTTFHDTIKTKDFKKMIESNIKVNKSTLIKWFKTIFKIIKNKK